MGPEERGVVVGLVSTRAIVTFFQTMHAHLHEWNNFMVNVNIKSSLTWQCLYFRLLLCNTLIIIVCSLLACCISWCNFGVYYSCGVLGIVPVTNEWKSLNYFLIKPKTSGKTKTSISTYSFHWFSRCLISHVPDNLANKIFFAKIFHHRYFTYPLHRNSTKSNRV